MITVLSPLIQNAAIRKYFFSPSNTSGEGSLTDHRSKDFGGAKARLIILTTLIKLKLVKDRKLAMRGREGKIMKFAKENSLSCSIFPKM